MNVSMARMPGCSNAGLFWRRFFSRANCSLNWARRSSHAANAACCGAGGEVGGFGGVADRGVERVGLGALAFGPGKGAHAGGIEQTYQHTVLM